MGMKLAALTAEPEKKDARINTCFVDMIQTSRPGGVCPEACLHCGAFGPESGGRQIQLTREELEANLRREIPSVKEGTRDKIVAAYLAPFVTTDVDVEPTNGNAFYDAAGLVYGLTGGASRMMCISHGIRSHVRVTKPFIDQIFSLFDYANRQTYELVSWKDCIERVQASSLPDDVKDSIYRAFANKLKLLVAEAEGTDVDSFVLETMNNLEFQAELRDKLLAYLAEDGFVDPNQLMLDQIELIDIFSKNGELLPVKNNANSNLSIARLQRIVELIQKGVVPGFILTVDFARSKGRLQMQTNLYSYIKTLEILRPILAPDSPGFLAVSIQGLQGDDVPRDHPYSAVRAHIFFQEVLAKSSLTEAEKAKIKYDTGRNYVKAGRVIEDPLLRDFVSEKDACEVIPYQDFVDRVVSRQRRVLRARLRADGGIEKQYTEPGRTYNTTVKGQWEQFIDAHPIREFTREGVARALAEEFGTDALLTPKERTRKRAIEWDAPIERENDIFLIKPFSVIRRGEDRRKALTLIKRLLRITRISQYMVEEKGSMVPIRFKNLKLSLLMALRSGENMGQLITEASPYRDAISRISSTGETIGAVLGQQSYYAGEVMALAHALEEKLGFDYLVRDLDAIYSERRIETPRDDDDNGGSEGGAGGGAGPLGGTDGAKESSPQSGGSGTRGASLEARGGAVFSFPVRVAVAAGKADHDVDERMTVDKKEA